MSKGRLEFNLPEEESEFLTAVNASSWKGVLLDMDQYLRNKIKYTSDDVPELYIETLQLVRDELWNLLNEKGLTLD